MKGRWRWFPGVLVAALLMGQGEAQEKKDPPPRPEPTSTEKATKLARTGDDLVKQGRIGEAIEIYRKVIRIVPAWAEARFRLGRLAFMEGQKHYFAHLKAKERAATAGAAGDGEEAEKQARLSQAARRIADPLLEEAEKEFKVVVKHKARPEFSMNAALNLGHISALYGRWQEAKDHYTKAGDIYKEASGEEGDDEAARKIREAIQLMDRELKKAAAKEKKESEGHGPNSERGSTTRAE